MTGPLVANMVGVKKRRAQTGEAQDETCPFARWYVWSRVRSLDCYTRLWHVGSSSE